MKLIVNGEVLEYEGESNLVALLEYVAPGRRVAVLVNNNVVAKTEHAQFILNPDDRIEILSFAGGG